MKSLSEKLDALHLARINGDITNDWEWDFIQDNHEKFTGIYEKDTTRFSAKVADKIDELYKRRCG